MRSLRILSHLSHKQKALQSLQNGNLTCHNSLPVFRLNALNMPSLVAAINNKPLLVIAEPAIILGAGIFNVREPVIIS